MIVVKLLLYPLILAGLATLVMLTAAEPLMVQAERSSSAFLTSRRSAPILRLLTSIYRFIGTQIAIPLMAMLTVAGIADLKHYDMIKELIGDNLHIMIIGWLVALTLFKLGDSVLSFASGRYFQIYAYVVYDYIIGLLTFVYSCFRVQLQVAVVAGPWLIVTRLYDIAVAVADYSIVAALLILGLYTWLAILTVHLIIRRAEEGKLMYDLGCLLSSVAMFIIIITDIDNNGTPMFNSY